MYLQKDLSLLGKDLKSIFYMQINAQVDTKVGANLNFGEGARKAI